MKIKNLCLFIFTLLLMVSCKEDYTPKPSGYFQMDLPEHEYKKFENDVCPCTFEIPKYAEVQRENHFFDEKPEHPCWLNVNFPYFNATIYISYKDVTSRAEFEKVISDSYKMTFNHSQKADFIDESSIDIPNHQVYGYQFDIGGDAASSTQFFITDSVNHFIRGALYFKSKPNVDSVRPVLDFLKTDMDHMIQTFEWK
ncbi:MAG TPA: gliding motility lipoprotein GldD [Chitinophagales bacterium]|nr:gliding motility lipoprotein GldD [Chitinophagales bacterium]